jgi:hypothetical protein
LEFIGFKFVHGCHTKSLVVELIDGRGALSLSGKVKALSCRNGEHPRFGLSGLSMRRFLPVPLESHEQSVLGIAQVETLGKVLAQ